MKASHGHVRLEPTLSEVNLVLFLHPRYVGILEYIYQVFLELGIKRILTVMFCASRALLRFESVAYKRRQVSSRLRKSRSSGGLSQASLFWVVSDGSPSELNEDAPDVT
jgi:hypothetical protein